MKKYLSIIFSILIFASVASAQFQTDLILTSPNAIWTDSRAYSNLNDAIVAVGANERTIVIVNEQIITNLIVPANITLQFERNGSITNSGQLTFQTKKIIADSRRIFTGTGDIDFAAGSVIKSGWFSNFVEAVNMTADDTVTLIVSEQSYITANCILGNNVNLKWESSSNRLIANAGFEFSNIGKIEAGDYQLFTGAGDFDFLDGTSLNLLWFNRLRSVLTWVESERVTIVVPGTNTVDYSDTVTNNIYFDFSSRQGIFSISAGVTLTIYSPANIQAASNQQIFDGDGSVAFTAPDGVASGVWAGETRDGIQAIIASLPAGGSLNIPDNGTYYTITATQQSEALTVSEDNIKITIDGELRATSAANQVNPPFVMVVSGDGCIIDGKGTLRGNGSFVVNETTTLNQPGLLKVTGDDVQVSGITFEDPQEVGLLGYGADRLTVKDCIFTGGPLLAAAIAPQHYYIFLAASDNVDISHNIFRRSASGGSSKQGVCNSSTVTMTGLSITDNQFIDMHENAVYCYVTHSKLQNNTIQYNQDLGEAPRGHAVKFGGMYNIVSGNSIYTALLGSITCYGAVGTIIDSNNIYGSGHVGIYIGHNVEGITYGYNNNIVSNNHLTAATTGTIYEGILISGSTGQTVPNKGNRITNNTLYGWGDAATTVRASIRVAGISGQVTLDNVVSDNSITGSNGHGIYINFIAQSVFKNNLIYDNPKANFIGVHGGGVDSTNLTLEGNIVEDYQTVPTLQFAFYTLTNTVLLNNECYNASQVSPFGHNTTNNVLGRGNRTSRTVSLFGTFTINNAAFVAILNANLVSGTIDQIGYVQLTPLNIAAAIIMGSSKQLYMAARVAGTGWGMYTADTTNVAATDAVFAYELVQ